MNSRKKGRITLVGAGPGDPELLTLKGLKAIQKAEVILYDALVNTELLSHNPTAEKVFVGKRLGKHSKKQSEINQELIDYALKGKQVVRLKGGDVSVFARATEEIQYAQFFNIETTVVPGISCYSGIAAQNKIPITKRCENESFWVTTGYTCEGIISPDISLAAKSSATVIILMGMSRLSNIVEEFKKFKPVDFPISIVQNGTLKNSKSISGTLESIEELVGVHRISNPAVIFIGNAANDAVTQYENLQNQETIWV